MGMIPKTFVSVFCMMMFCMMQMSVIAAGIKIYAAANYASWAASVISSYNYSEEASQSLIEGAGDKGYELSVELMDENGDSRYDKARVDVGLAVITNPFTKSTRKVILTAYGR